MNLPEIERTYNIRKQQTWQSLFMRTNGKGNNPNAPAYNRILFWKSKESE